MSSAVRLKRRAGLRPPRPGVINENRISTPVVFIIATVLLAQKPEALQQANLGVSLAQKGDYPGAIQAYKSAIAIDPALPGINLNLGLAYFKSGKFQQALSAFETEEAKTHTDQATTLIAMSYFGLKRYREAAERLKPVVAAQPNNSELSYLLATCYVWSRQTDEGMQLFQQSFALGSGLARNPHADGRSVRCGGPDRRRNC